MRAGTQSIVCVAAAPAPLHAPAAPARDVREMALAHKGREAHSCQPQRSTTATDVEVLPHPKSHEEGIHLLRALAANCGSSVVQPHLFMAQILLELEDKLAPKHFFRIDEWFFALPSEFEKCPSKISAVDRRQDRVHNGRRAQLPGESAASVKTKAKNLLQSTCSWTRERGKPRGRSSRRSGLPPEKGWRDVSASSPARRRMHCE